MNAATILEQLWADHHDAIYFYIAKRTDLDVAEDLTQDVYLRAYESLAAGKGYTSSPRAWLFRSAHNAMIDFYRHRDGVGTIPHVPPMELSTEVENMISQEVVQPHDALVRSMTDAAISEAIDQLKESHRQLIELHLDGGRQIDLSTEQQVNYTAMKLRKYRAVGAMRRILERDSFMSDRMAA